ncbi:MAG TPA: metalloprotease [Thermoplasmata archaeon]|nr:metalloprotease [Thermoplasmata archaeon]
MNYPPGSSSYSYTWAPARPATARVRTSPRELLEIGVAFLVLTFDFVLILWVGGLFTGFGLGVLGSVPLAVVLAAAGISFTAFVCHEMAHKISAQRRGYWAEFRWSPIGLVFSVFTAYLGFLFAAPGATVVGGMGDVREWGRTSFAGPASNMGFAVIFYVGALGLWFAGSPYWFWLVLVAYFNAFFAAFNLVPVGPLDGAKVLRWDTAVWAVGFAVAAVLAAICWISIYIRGTPVL